MWSARDKSREELGEKQRRDRWTWLLAVWNRRNAFVNENLRRRERSEIECFPIYHDRGTSCSAARMIGICKKLRKGQAKLSFSPFKHQLRILWAEHAPEQWCHGNWQLGSAHVVTLQAVTFGYPVKFSSTLNFSLNLKNFLVCPRAQWTWDDALEKQAAHLLHSPQHRKQARWKAKRYKLHKIGMWNMTDRLKGRWALDGGESKSSAAGETKCYKVTDRGLWLRLMMEKNRGIRGFAPLLSERVGC